MASGLSKAHQRQSSRNKTQRETRRRTAITELNQLRRLLRHAKHYAMTLTIGPTPALITFFYPRTTPIEDKSAGKAWSRCADLVGLARTRDLLHQRGIPQANTTFTFAKS